MKASFFLNFLAAALTLAGHANADDAAKPCINAGPDAYFCAGDTFTQLEVAHGAGVTFWLHEAGYLSKVLVESGDGTPPTQGQIERQILTQVSQQAASIGHDFAFSDLQARSVNGAPYGTFSYQLKGADQDSAVLHSYVAVGDRVLQVVSQALVKMTGADLEHAHDDALRAVRLDARTDDT